MKILRGQNDEKATESQIRGSGGPSVFNLTYFQDDMLNQKEIVAYFRMLDSTIRQRLTPVKYFSYDIVNPPDPLSVAGSFTFEQDLIHVIGIIDNEGRMFVIRLRDPYEFTRSKEIESVTQVSELANKARCSYDLRSGATEYFNPEDEQ